MICDYWEELSTRELSDALEVPQGTVKSRLRRAREALREALAVGSGTGEADDERLGASVLALRGTIDGG